MCLYLNIERGTLNSKVYVWNKGIVTFMCRGLDDVSSGKSIFFNLQTLLFHILYL